MDTNICGFNNIGNTCYMNSTLQALLSSSILNETLYKKISTKLLNNNINNVSQLLIEYHKLIKDLRRNKDHKTYTPSSMKKTISKYNPYFKGSRQHDAQELLLYILNEIIDADYIDQKKRNNEISDIIKEKYYGKVKQFIRCNGCQKVTSNNINFLDIILPIPNNNNNIGMIDCFKIFSSWEHIDNSERLCEYCKNECTIDKRIQLEEIPDIVVITFNRFNNNRKNNKNIKIYPNISLDGKSLKLISTINHSGGLNGGHYTANVTRNTNNGLKWFNTNDSHFRKINDKNIDSIYNNPSVYICIYELNE